jgi:hypothetical protein
LEADAPAAEDNAKLRTQTFKALDKNFARITLPLAHFPS